jgi:hypothetical protein
MKTNEKMTVKQLIEQLQRLPADAAVRIKQPTHDYWRTMGTAHVAEVEMLKLEWSGYHSTYVLPKGAVDLDDGDADGKTLVAVVIG